MQKSSDARRRNLEVPWALNGPPSACRICGDRKAAFLFVAVFPPPAAGALRLAGAHRAGARGAADRQKSFLVQRIDRDLVGRGQFFQSLAGPIAQRVELEKIALSIGNHETDLRAICRLL